MEVGDYLQERSDISFGFYVPNAICTLSLNSRTFSQKSAADTVVDSLTEYAFATDIFRKNVPYRLLITFAYQSLGKSFVTAATNATLNSIVIGSEVSVALSEMVLLQVGMEGTVYSFGTGLLLGGASPFLFRAYSGVKVSSDAIPFLNKIL